MGDSKEIEITPEMIEAGATEVFLSDPEGDIHEAAVRVYMAMKSASSGAAVPCFQSSGDADKKHKPKSKASEKPTKGD